MEVVSMKVFHKVLSSLLVAVLLLTGSVAVAEQEIVNPDGRVMVNVTDALTITQNGKDFTTVVDRSKLPAPINVEFEVMGVPSYGGMKYNLYDPYVFITGGLAQTSVYNSRLEQPGHYYTLILLFDIKRKAIAYGEAEIDLNSDGSMKIKLGDKTINGTSSSSGASATPAPSSTAKPSAGPATVKSIAVSVTKVQLNVEQTKTIKVQAVMSDNTRKDVTDDSDYFSNDTEVADVDGGNITGIAKGETSILVNYKGIEKTVPVEVIDPENLELTKLEASEKSVKLKAGQQMELYITGVYEDNSREDVTGEVLWQSSKGSVASVVDGIITAKAIGAATITASLEGKTVQVKLIVEKAKKLKSLTASSNSLTIKEEGTATLKVTATYVDNTKEDVTTKVIWTIANTDIVDVRSGKFYAQDLGKTVVKGKFDTKLVTVNVTVK
jgi:hypothetical protein